MKLVTYNEILSSVILLFDKLFCNAIYVLGKFTFLKIFFKARFCLFPILIQLDKAKPAVPMDR